MLYSEIIAVCSQIHTKHINTLCGQNVECRTYRAVNTLRLSYKNQPVNAVQWNNRCLFLDPHKTQNTCRVGCRQSSLYSSKCLPQCHEPNGAAGGSLPICSKSLFINRRPKYSPRLQVTWSTYTVLNSFCESDNRSWTQKLYYNVYSNRPPSRVHISHQIFPAYSFVLQWYLG